MRTVIAILLSAFIFGCTGAQYRFDRDTMAGSFANIDQGVHITIETDGTYVMAYRSPSRIWIPSDTLSFGTWIPDDLCVLLTSDPSIGGSLLDARVEEAAGSPDHAVVRIHSPHEIALSARTPIPYENRIARESYNLKRNLFQYIVHLYIDGPTIEHHSDNSIITVDLPEDQRIYHLTITLVPDPVSFFYLAYPTFTVVHFDVTPQSRIFDVYLDHFTTSYAWYRRYDNECLLVRDVDTVELRGLRYARVGNRAER